MFNFNELRFLDELIIKYLKDNQGLPLNIRNHILKIDNKIVELQNAIRENAIREIEEDKKYNRKIVK